MLTFWWQNLTTERIYEVWNISFKKDTLSLDKINNIEEFILWWKDGALDIKIDSWEVYWVILENEEQVKKLINILRSWEFSFEIKDRENILKK